MNISFNISTNKRQSLLSSEQWRCAQITAGIHSFDYNPRGKGLSV